MPEAIALSNKASTAFFSSLPINFLAGHGLDRTFGPPSIANL
jgi:hypothetical protein